MPVRIIKKRGERVQVSGFRESGFRGAAPLDVWALMAQAAPRFMHQAG
jgi:hypothetical protein